MDEDQYPYYDTAENLEKAYATVTPSEDLLAVYTMRNSNVLSDEARRHDQHGFLCMVTSLRIIDLFTEPDNPNKFTMVSTAMRMLAEVQLIQGYYECDLHHPIYAVDVHYITQKHRRYVHHDRGTILTLHEILATRL